MPKLRIGDLIVEKPIIQGGMGVGISMSGLASAVANEGGVGVISSVGLGMMTRARGKKVREANRNLLIEEIRKAKSMSDGIIGVNIMVALTDYDDMVKCSLDENIDILFLGAGLPLRFSKDISLTQLWETRTKFVPIVSSARAAQIIFKFWQKNFHRIPDGVVVEGPMAGGHLGFKKEQIYDPDFALEKIVPDVLNTIHQYEERFDREIPVIAAGGIFTGEDIHKFLDLGAQGVQMATRFVATYECDASDEFKQSYLRCKKEDIAIIESPVGLPGRAIRNRFLNEVSAGERKPFKCPWKCLKTCDFKETPYCIAQALVNAQKGEVDEGFTFAGENAYRVDKIVSVKELFAALESEYSRAVPSKEAAVA